MTGTIRHIDDRGGYGFISPDDDDTRRGSHFFHWSAITDGRLRFGEELLNQRVEFDTQLDRNLKLRAGNIRLATEC